MTEGENAVRLSIRIPAAMRDDIGREAKRYECRPSDIVRQALRRFMKE